MLNEEEKRELLEMARSGRIREDFRRIAENRHNPFLVNGAVDLEKFIGFLNEYNESINHYMRPLRRIAGKDMKL